MEAKRALDYSLSTGLTSIAQFISPRLVDYRRTITKLVHYLLQLKYEDKLPCLEKSYFRHLLTEEA